MPLGFLERAGHQASAQDLAVDRLDEALIREKRLIPLSDPRSLDVRKRDREREPVRRDPALMLELLLSTGES